MKYEITQNVQFWRVWCAACHPGHKAFQRPPLLTSATGQVASPVWAPLAAVALVAMVLDLVTTTLAAEASSGSWYAYATATTSGLTTCPQTTDATQECTLAEALSDVTPGGTVYLATNGVAYTGNWVIATPGTTASSPVTVQPAPGVAGTMTDTDSGSPCETASCDGSVLTVETGVYAEVEDIIFDRADNTYLGAGGAINNEGSLTATASTFLDTDAVNTGGAISNGGTLTVVGSTSIGDEVSEDEAYGGAISNGGNANISGTIFWDNSAPVAGGAIYNEVPATLTVSGSTFWQNSVANYGGAVDNYEGSFTVSDSTFLGNEATEGLGGASIMRRAAP